MSKACTQVLSTHQEGKPGRVGLLPTPGAAVTGRARAGSGHSLRCSSQVQLQNFLFCSALGCHFQFWLYHSRLYWIAIALNGDLDTWYCIQGCFGR